MKHIYYNAVSHELATFEKTPPYPWIRVAMPREEEPEPIAPPPTKNTLWKYKFLMITGFPMALNLAIGMTLLELNVPLYIALPAGFVVSCIVSFIIGMSED